MKKICVNGIVCDSAGAAMRTLECIITNDKNGKTLSINNGKMQFTIPFEPIEKFLK